jgi:hypothetical protein
MDGKSLRCECGSLGFARGFCLGGFCDDSDYSGDQIVALTLEAEQRMADVGLVGFFTGDQAAWQATVQATKDFVRTNFPAGSLIRHDDVAKGLIPILEVHEGFKTFREAHKLRGKFWIKDFADLLTDRTWATLT